MKKRLSLILRITVAIIGLAYIGYSVNWLDTAEAPKGSAAIERGESPKFRVVSGDFDPMAPLKSPLTVEHLYKDQVKHLTLLPDQIGVGEGKFVLRPGIVTTLRHAKMGYLLLGLLLIGPLYPIQAARWRMLLRSRGIDVSFRRSFRLVMVGSFFNYAMPGSTGGDVVKAYYAAARSDRRADAVMSVVVDRVVGLLGLVLVASLAGLLVVLHRVMAGTSTAPGAAGLEQCLRRASHASAYLWLGVACVVVLSAVYFSRHLRRGLGLERLLAKLLPADSIASKIDRATVGYANRKGTVAMTVLMSVPLQYMLATSTAFAGFAVGIGMERSIYVLLMAVVPVLFLIGALPISYQGFGIMEGLGFFLLAAPGVANTNQIIVMLLLARLFQVFYSMFGSIFLLGGDIHMHPERQGQDAPAPGNGDKSQAAPVAS